VDGDPVRGDRNVWSLVVRTSFRSHLPWVRVRVKADENESIYIPIGAVHRLENPGKIQLELIEVQTGSYFGEDDIIRIEDDYQRT
jgi:hypothetical protein